MPPTPAMQFSLDSAFPILERTPAVLNELLCGLSDEWTTRNEGPDTWSPYDAVGHLIHGERTDWIPRIRIVLECGGTKPFDPFDRFAQFEESRGKSMNTLLDEFILLRDENLMALEEMDLQPDDFRRKGLHPELGEVSLAQLIAAWVVHDLGHIAQITRVMARRYDTETGPWARYLPILTDRQPS